MHSPSTSSHEACRSYALERNIAAASSRDAVVPPLPRDVRCLSLERREVPPTLRVAPSLRPPRGVICPREARRPSTSRRGVKGSAVPILEGCALPPSLRPGLRHAVPISWGWRTIPLSSLAHAEESGASSRLLGCDGNGDAGRRITLVVVGGLEMSRYEDARGQGKTVQLLGHSPERESPASPPAERRQITLPPTTLREGRRRRLARADALPA